MIEVVYYKSCWYVYHGNECTKVASSMDDNYIDVDEMSNLVGKLFECLGVNFHYLILSKKEQKNFKMPKTFEEVEPLL